MCVARVTAAPTEWPPPWGCSAPLQAPTGAMLASPSYLVQGCRLSLALKLPFSSRPLNHCGLEPESWVGRRRGSRCFLELPEARAIMSPGGTRRRCVDFSRWSWQGWGKPQQHLRAILGFTAGGWRFPLNQVFRLHTHSPPIPPPGPPRGDSHQARLTLDHSGPHTW